MLKSVGIVEQGFCELPQHVGSERRLSSFIPERYEHTNHIIQRKVANGLIIVERQP